MAICLNVFMFRYTLVPFMLENKNQTVPEEEKENDELESTRNDNEALIEDKLRQGPTKKTQTYQKMILPESYFFPINFN